MTTPYRIAKNKLFKAEDSEYVRKWLLCDVPVGETEPEWLKAKIPFEVWQQMKSFCLWTQHEFESEGLVLLFFDDENGWVPWAPPQETWGMTVDTEEDDPRYAEQRKDLPELMLGSLHHHCTSSAFASGTDDNDEKNKDGIHFTLGNLDKEVLDIDSRFLQGGHKVKVSARNWVEFPEWVHNIKYDDLRKEVMDRMLAASELVEFPEFWKENITKGFRKTYGHNNYGGWQMGNNNRSNSKVAEFKKSVTPIKGVQDFLDHTAMSPYDVGFVLVDNAAATYSEEERAVIDNLDNLLKGCGITKKQLTDHVEAATGFPISEFADYQF